MKEQKDKACVLLIIALVCFTVIPFCFSFLKTNEGMTYDMKDKNISMDAIELTRSPTQKVYGYCLGGELKCESGISPSFIGTYNDRNGKTHNIYNGVCGDCKEEDKNPDGDCRPGTNEFIQCEMTNNINKSGKSIDYGDPDKNLTFIPKIGAIIPSWWNRQESSSNGYKHPDNYLPWDISNGYVYLYNSDNVNVDVSFTACYLYESKEECDKKLENNSGNADNIPIFKCIADNGSKTGDPLCCGQDGILQNTKHNCPSEYPKCVEYKCGETWGKCVEK